jgi:hypothetical protein
MTTVRKKPAPTCSRCSHNGVTWRELNGKRTWFCETHLKEAENEAREAAAKRYEATRLEDLKPSRVVVPRSREVKPYAPRDPALMCGHPTTKAASGTCRCYYPCSFHGPWRKNQELAAPAHPVSNTAVEHPPHYNVGKFEVIDIIEDWRLGFNLGNVVKYVARAEHKGRELEDLDKAAWYIQREIARRKG